MSNLRPPSLSYEGAGAILLDAAASEFNEECQYRVWALAKALKALPHISETVPGMNNLMVVFDPLTVDGAVIEQQMLDFWRQGNIDQVEGEYYEVEVDYGGADSDLGELAASKSISLERLIELHSSPTYRVAAVGAMPGFVYLSGLETLLAAPRRANPRANVKAGSVIIGGTQAGIMPITAPSGWHIVGHTDVVLFDATRDRPALFKASDQIRFVPRAVIA